MRKKGEQEGRGRRRLEDVQANDSHRKVAQQEILRNQDWGDTWLWTYGIYTTRRVTSNSHGNKGGPIAKGTHNDEGETGGHRGRTEKGKRKQTARNTCCTVEPNRILVLLTE